jgi:hypothetical protein
MIRRTASCAQLLDNMLNTNSFTRARTELVSEFEKGRRSSVTQDRWQHHACGRGVRGVHKKLSRWIKKYGIGAQAAEPRS